MIAVVPNVSAPASSPLSLQTTPAASGPWLDRLNQWRVSTGLPTLAENTTWSNGDYNHAVYMVKNDLVTHYETPGVPYYTTDGDTAARNGNIQVSSTTSTTDPQVIDWWMAAPFHAMGMMDPRLTQTGFGSYREVKSGWDEGATLDTIRGNSFTGGTYPVYFPGNGTTEPLTTYRGGEFPDPLQACPGYSAPTGLPVFIEVGGNVNTSVGSVHSFTGNGTPLSHCVIDSSNSAVASYLYTRGGVILVPQQPLQAGVKYVVALTVNGTPYTWTFTVGNFTACTSVSESAAPPPSSMPGTSVTFTASASGCTHPLYQFWILAPGHAWQIVQPYSSAATFMWNTTGLPTGNYLYTVWARDSSSPGSCGSLGCQDAYFPGTVYTLGSAPCSSVTDTAAPASPQAAGITVTFTASASGCANPLYEFWILRPGSQWQIVQSYSSSRTFSWNTTGLAGGTYLYTVWARDAGSPGTSCGSLGCEDTYFPGTAFSLTSQACTSVTESAAPASPQLAGTTVTFTASASGCPQPLYQFWILAPGYQWKVGQAYSSTATFSWSTTGLAPGSYLYTVWARDSSSPGTSCGSLGCEDAYFPGTAYNLTSPCASATESAAPASPQLSGTTVTFTAASTGCPQPLYQFWILAPGHAWQIVQAYSGSATFSWNTTGLAPGSYLYTVWARDASSPGTSCGSLGCEDAYFPGTTYSLTGQACSSVTESAAPGSPQHPGTTVTLTAAASGCPHPLYQFWILAPGHAWQVVQAYSSTATFSWTTTGLAPGSYLYTVWARDSSSPGTSCGSLGCEDAYFPGTAYTLN